jgi:hypothetical protein
MALTIAGSSLRSRAHGSAIYTADDDPMQVADDNALVAWELLGVVSGLRSELVERDVCREQLVECVRLTVGLSERGDREPPTTNVADQGHDLDRLAIGVLLVPFAKERAAARGSRHAAQ